MTVGLADMPDGLHLHVPADVYHERSPDIVSRSGLAKFLQAPAKYEAWANGATDASSPALEFGTAFHCALLEPEQFARLYVVEPDFGDCRKKEARGLRDEWRADNAGKKLLTAADDEAIRGMSASVREHPFASRMLIGGAREVTALWRDQATGLRCKARADYYSEPLKLLVDVKTTDDARAHAFERSVAKYGYHMQRAFYGDGFAACGAPVDNFVFLVVEKTPPYLVALYVLDVAAVARGREAIRQAMSSLAECLRSKKFPGYTNSIQTIGVPPWAA